MPQLITSITFWAAVGTLVSTTGKFLDDHHVTVEKKSRMRSVLIRFFIFVQQPQVPNLPLNLWRALKGAVVKLGLPLGLPVAACVLYLLATTGFYVGRIVTRDPPKESYVHYILFWVDDIFWVFYLLFVITGVAYSFWLGARVIDRFSKTTLWYAQLLYIAGGCVGVVLVFLVLLLPMAFMGDKPGYAPGYYWDLVQPVGVITTLPLVCIVAWLLTLTLVGSVLAGLQWVLVNALDAASSPRTSPFTYATAPIGLVIAALGIAKEIATAHSVASAK